MSAVTTTPPKSGSAGAGVVTWVVAIGASGLGWLACGRLAAIPAGAGLTLLAADDFATRRFSIRTLSVISALVAVALVADAAVNDSWSRLGFAAGGTAATVTLLVIAWLATPGIAFGDVLLGAFTLVLPFYLSFTAVGVTVVFAVLAAAAYVAVRAAWSGAARSATVPLAPALLVGWLCGVVAG